MNDSKARAPLKSGGDLITINVSCTTVADRLSLLGRESKPRKIRRKGKD